MINMHGGSQLAAANLDYSFTWKLFKLHRKVIQMQDRGKKFTLDKQTQTTLACVIWKLQEKNKKVILYLTKNSVSKMNLMLA